MNNIGNIELVYSLFNQYLFQEAKNNIDLVDLYYRTNPATLGNGLVSDLIDSIRKYPLESIDEPLFRSILVKQGKTSKESDEILKSIIKYKMYDNKAIDPARKYLRGICSSSIIKMAENKFQNDPEGFIKYLKNSDYKSDYSDLMSIENFNQIDINSILAGNGKGFASRYDWINRAFDPLMKYEAGQICIISAPPGCFTGDTRVRLSDGTRIKFKNLMDGILEGKEYYTFCKTKLGEVKETKIKDCWITKKTKSLVDVSIDNGSRVRCTPDHKFLMRDGTYKEAKDLVNGDSLMSDWTKCEYNLKELYDNKDKYLEYLHLKGYLIYKITNTVNGKCYIGDTSVNLDWRLFTCRYYSDHDCAHLSWCYENSDSHLYRSMRKYGLENFTIRILTFDESKTEKYYIDLYNSYKNGYNNSCDGIGSYKGLKGRKYIYNKELNIEKLVPEQDLQYYLNNGYELGRNPSNSINWKNTSTINKSGFYNKDYARKIGKLGNESQRKNNVGIFNEEFRKEKMYKVMKEKKLGSCHNPELQKEVRLKATESAKIKRFSNDLLILDKMVSEGIIINKESFESRRKEFPKAPNTTLVWDKLINHLSLDQKIKYGIDNHKVTSVKFVTLDNEIPVYDLEVEDESHNFLLDSEVFVHNCGKSLFCMGEALTMAMAGAKVHYIALGDLKPKDFVVRMGAVYSGASFADVQLNLQSIYKALNNAVGDRLGLTIVPSAKVSADQYIEYIKDKDYEVLFIDYDSNFLSSAADNLYSEYGKIYDRLTELSGIGKLVFIASQPTKPSWKYEEINMEDIGESARKVHSADVIITIGRVITSRNHLGIMKIAKNRRGEEGVAQPYIRLNNGRFIPLPDEVYENLKQIKDKRMFSEGDINQLIIQNSQLKQAAMDSIMKDSGVPVDFFQQNNLGFQQTQPMNNKFTKRK